MLACAHPWQLKHRGVQHNGHPPAIEGSASDDWLLVDGGSVVVSVMARAAREKLALEAHWEEHGALELELEPNPNIADVSTGLLAASAAPPEHWAHASADEPQDAIYREDGVDAYLAGESASSEWRAASDVRSSGGGGGGGSDMPSEGADENEADHYADDDYDVYGYEEDDEADDGYYDDGYYYDREDEDGGYYDSSYDDVYYDDEYDGY